MPEVIKVPSAEVQVLAAGDKARRAAVPALWTAAFTFAGLFLGTLTGWLGDVQSAIDAWSAGDEFILPDPSVLSKGLFSAAGAAVTGAANFAVRWVQTVTGFGSTPSYD